MLRDDGRICAYKHEKGELEITFSSVSVPQTIRIKLLWPMSIMASVERFLLQWPTW